MATSKRQSARTKRASSKRATSRRKEATTGGGEFVCPECGRSFGRAAALGAHRSRAHGVAGQSGRATSRRARTSQAKASGARAARASASANGVDRDGLLKSVFPGGIPAREEVVRAATVWLDEAERLARMR